MSMKSIASKSIERDDYSRAIKELKEQLKYANEQLEIQTPLMRKLKDDTTSLVEKKIENIKEW